MKSTIRKSLQQEIEAVSKQAAADRASYVSTKELVDMLGPNISGPKSLHGMFAGLGIKTIYTSRGGVKNTWMTEEQAKLVIREVLSHPARLRTGDTE